MNSEPAAEPHHEPFKALSVVIPVFNEETWIRTAVEALHASAAAAGLELDVVVVDDGSTDSTPEILASLADATGLRVVSQRNAGRVAARGAGLRAAREEWVLLLDSRVIVGPESLAWIRNQLTDHPDRSVWCGHVDVETRGNEYAAFWAGLVKVGWWRYTRNPRLVSFGAEEFDAFPKGTGCLLMRRESLLEALGAFDSLYDEAHLASDDTRLLRHVAGQQHIWLSPDFNFRYHGKSGARGFVKQSYFRGTTFVDGYLGQPGTVRRALLGAVVAGTAILAVGVRHPKAGAVGVAGAVAAIPAAVHLAGGTRGEVRAASVLTPAFLPLFGAGVLRGFALAAKRLLRPSSATESGK